MTSRLTLTARLAPSSRNNRYFSNSIRFYKLRGRESPPRSRCPSYHSIHSHSIAVPFRRLREMSGSGPRYISQEEAVKIDEELMSDEGAFSLDQLMELAGLACAQTLQRCYPVEDGFEKVLVCCGPGNQGGDGLVAARHLHMFGYRVSVFLPKSGKKEIYQRLLKQCQNLSIPILSTEEEFGTGFQQGKCDVVMDTIFGFSFHPPVRSPFDTILRRIQASSIPIVSIDIPSGWDVSKGPQALTDESGESIEVLDPDVLLSLTAPKSGVKEFGPNRAASQNKNRYRHFLGGRFVPDSLAAKYKLQLPKYPGSDGIVELEV